MDDLLRHLDAASIKLLYESNPDTNAFTDAEALKLSGIEASAQVNTVDSVNGKTGVVVIDGTEIELVDGGAVTVTGAISDLANTKADKSGDTLTNTTVNGVTLSTTAFAGFYLDGVGSYSQVNSSNVINSSTVLGAYVTAALDNLLAAIPVYGTQRHQVADLTYTATTNKFDTPNATNEKLVLTTGSLPLGQYVLTANFQFMMEKDGRFEAAIYDVTNAAYLSDPMKYKSDENSDELAQTFITDDLTLSGIHTFKLIFGPEQSGWDTDIGDATLELIRVS